MKYKKGDMVKVRYDLELDNRLKNITTKIEALETQDLINESRKEGC